MNPELAQKVIESAGLAGKLVSLIEDHNILSIPSARQIVGNNYLFGPDEWRECVHLTIDKVPEIPWTEKEIKASNMKQFLFLGVGYINGENVSPIYLKHRFPELKIDLCCLEMHDFMRESCESRWYLMPVGVFPRSTNKYIENQANLLRSTPWWIPNVAERFTANVLFYLLNKKYLDNETWVTTKTNFGANEYVSVRSVNNKLCLGTGFENISKDSLTGVAASMRLPT